GVVTAAPYAAGGARLALSPVRFTQGHGGLAFSTVASIDGPLADGRVRGLTLPLSGRAGRTVEVNAACVPLVFSSLSIAGMTIGATRLPLCPVGGAMLRVVKGRAGGGMAVPQPRLVGRVGGQPLTIGAADLRVDIAEAGFTVDRMRVRLGGEGGTRLDVANLRGRTGAGGIGGRFTGADGAIANVPLLLTRGEGGWRLANGRLALTAAATVSDADAAPRFHPLSAPDIALDLAAGVIRVTGSLREPRSGVRVTDVAIRHDLRAGEGGATLAVPGITFGPAFQPEAITRLTLGIVANVAGTVSGGGRVDWSRAGVTSSGEFATEDMNLAAAFGPVTGISTKIHFSDLLKLETPPGQIVTVAAFNPGIAVEGGIVGYQLLAGQKVAVGGGKWPFFGGALILEPTVLDFGQPVERRMTFRVEAMDAAKFLERFDFRNVAATGLFDGSLPMIFDERGGRISGGRLVVRPPGGTLAYVGELTNKDLGMFGKLAFDALKSIRYSNLAIELDGALDSEIVSRIVFTGTNESPKDEHARGWLKDLTGLPFRFNIVIRAPFRGLTSSAEAFVNPRGLIGDAALRGATIVEDGAPVKPPLSRNER
ncbi:MAG: YdbH domain-containing protein, partial [Sphingomonas sp.]